MSRVPAVRAVLCVSEVRGAVRRGVRLRGARPAAGAWASELVTSEPATAAAVAAAAAARRGRSPLWACGRAASHRAYWALSGCGLPPFPHLLGAQPVLAVVSPGAQLASWRVHHWNAKRRQALAMGMLLFVVIWMAHPGGVVP